MSIYALPGSLSDLISSGRSTKPTKAEAEEACAISKETSKHDIRSNSSIAAAKKPAPITTTSTATTNNPLGRRPSSGSVVGQTEELSDNSQSSHSSSSRNSNSNVFIAVKGAKIDPERLIRSLAMNTEPKKTPPKPVAEGASEEVGSSSSSAVSNSPRRRRSRKTDDVDSSRKCDPHEDAIKFEISVSFNGREYTATRSLPRILQFRYDLIEEFRARRMWRERRRKRKESRVPRLAKVKDLSEDEDEEEDNIPEIPRLSEDAAGSSGFTMLNALLRPYGPALERWLHTVLSIVPHDSQCLTQFLWEPVSGQPTSETFERRNSSKSNLDAIKETEDLDQYDSDTDDYLLIH